MRNRKDVAIAVMQEGIGYFLTGYCDASHMPDKELEEAFQKAVDAINEFENLLPEIEEE